MSLRRVVVVSNKPQIREIAQEIAHEVFMADDLDEAREIVNTVTPDMMVLDEAFGPQTIREFLQGTDKDPSRPCACVVVGSDEAAFSDDEYERAGISCCLRGPQEYGRLREIAASSEPQIRQTETSPGNDGCFIDDTAAAFGMVGRSEAIRETIEMIRLVAQSHCNPILILGETGTGKEVAARAIHGIRHPDRPFVAVNCAALTANLLESELFGHVKGSFTGADRDKTGLIEIAGEGSLFLDEISEMPLDLQAKLLRVLQERTFRKVGGVRDLVSGATIIASSNRHLKKDVEEKRFRQDLYYRLNICPITLAPLRSPERRDDVAVLAEYFLRTSTIRGEKQTKIVSITGLALEALCRHPWPGNVRELRNVIERAILLETTDTIGLSSIRIEAPHADETGGDPVHSRVRDFSLEKAERELIARALHETGWQKTQAASLLGITRATLYAKVKQYNIQREGARHSGIDPARCCTAPCEPVPVG